MSPAMSAESEDPRRAVSPANARVTKPVNGSISQPLAGGSINGKGKTPVRPHREDEEEEGDSPTELSARAASPDLAQARARSPAQNSVASRAVSPAAGGVDAYGMVGISPFTGRQSPAIDRTKPPNDAFYNPHVNGHHHSSSRGGSVTNVTADLLRDLKAKDVELEGLKRQLAWMKEGLGKASRSGYVYVDRDGNSLTNDLSEEDDERVTEIVLKFKQFKAQIQVRIMLRSWRPHLT